MARLCIPAAIWHALPSHPCSGLQVRTRSPCSSERDFSDDVTPCLEHHTSHAARASRRRGRRISLVHALARPEPPIRDNKTESATAILPGASARYEGVQAPLRNAPVIKTCVKCMAKPHLAPTTGCFPITLWARVSIAPASATSGVLYTSCGLHVLPRRSGKRLEMKTKEIIRQRVSWLA